MSLGIAAVVIGLVAQGTALTGLTALQLGTSWEYLHLWPLSHVAWAVCLHGVWRLAGPSLLAHASWGSVATSSRTAAVAGVVGCTVVAMGTAFGPRQFDLTQGRQTAATVGPVRERISALAGGDRARPPLLFLGDTWLGQWTVGWGVAWPLQAADYPIHVTTSGQAVEDWEYRKYTTAPHDAIRVLMVENDPPEAYGLSATDEVTSAVPGLRVYVGRPR